MPPFIAWHDEKTATGEVADVYREYFERNPSRTQMPGILKCFSQRPDFLRDVMAMSYRVHFSDGHLTRRIKEMIATYVSALNQCPYWVGSHAAFLQLQGQDADAVGALRRADVAAAGLPENEQTLLEFVKLLTQESARCTQVDIQKLRDASWTDPQIAEAVYITALFAFFNRVADAFGLEDPHYEQINGMQPPK